MFFRTNAFAVIKLKRRIPIKEQNKIKKFFNNWAAYYLLKRIHKEFLIKSKRGTDSTGIKWKELSQRTIMYKSLQRGEKTAFKKLSRSEKMQFRMNRNVPINIDTGKLVKSLKPGRVVDGKYIPVTNQKVEANSRGIKIELKLPYADDVQRERPYVPLDLTEWMSYAYVYAKIRTMRELAKQDLV